MMTGPVYKRFVSLRQEKRKAFAVLIDPDKVSVSQIRRMLISFLWAAASW
jgi:hypothetical protein